MATVTIINDVRRTDLRTSVLGNPYWISSGVVDASATAAIDDKYVMLFSFPTAGEFIYVEQVIVQVVTAFTAGTTFSVGLSTLLTDDVTTGGVATTVGNESFMEAADITATTIGYYHAAAAAGNAWLTAKIAAVPTSPYMLTGVAAAVPAVHLIAANAGTVAAGKAIVHMCINKFKY
jgi:hypothetical protein